MFLTGMVISLIVLLVAAWSPVSAMPTLNASCMPANPAFGIFSEELDDMDVDVPSIQPCLVAPVAAPVAQPVASASEPRHVSLGLEKAVAAGSPEGAGNIWLVAYLAMAHDEVE